jgi:hypothetical protein
VRFVTDDLFSARTRRRLARSPFDPIPEDDDMAQLRVGMLGRLLAQRLTALGPMTVAEAIDVLDSRAPGRGGFVVRYALEVRLVRRVAGADGEADTLEVVGRPSSRALAA